jgi:hypothetical protein
MGIPAGTGLRCRSSRGARRHSSQPSHSVRLLLSPARRHLALLLPSRWGVPSTCRRGPAPGTTKLLSALTLQLQSVTTQPLAAGAPKADTRRAADAAAAPAPPYGPAHQARAAGCCWPPLRCLLQGGLDQQAGHGVGVHAAAGRGGNQSGAEQAGRQGLQHRAGCRWCGAGVGRRDNTR